MQQSSLNKTREVTRVLVTSVVKQYEMLANFSKLSIRVFIERGDKKDIEILLSMVTPRFLTLSVASKEISSICKEGYG